MVKELAEADFVDVGDDPLCLTEIPSPIERLAQNFALTLGMRHDDQLGPMKSSFFRIEDVDYYFETPDYSDFADKTFLYVRSTEPDTERALKLFLDVSNLAIQDLGYVTEFLGTPKWTLHRIDDNGNEFVMHRFHIEAIAKSLQIVYTQRGHKQTYWVTYDA